MPNNTDQRKATSDKIPTQFTVYLSPELATWLREEARKNFRTFTAQTEMVLLEGRKALAKKSR